MALKAKIKFKSANPGCGNDDNDVIIIKVKRNHWEDFSQLLGAARDNTDSYHLTYSEVKVIENTFDNTISENT